MAANSVLHLDRLGSVQSSDQLRLLDDIDKLRSQGISHYVALPQLVVCGDQSSGKSSVLEAISGIPFPTKDSLCTRFATEVILRRTSIVTVSVAIVPGQTRSESDRQRLLGFRQQIVDFNEFPSLVEKAKTVMDVSMAGNAFSNDILRVEVSGPDRPHLTIVDLPGLIHSENRLQTAADVQLVGEMARSYMEKRRSIILAVVSAKNDYANQIVLKMTRDVDPNGLRTMGVITKPDTLSVGSESELGFIDLAKNEHIVFRLGWHILRNRDYESRDSSKEARDLAEEQFFSQGIWKDLPRQMVGINTLRDRLSKVLLDQIKTELPSLVEEISVSIEECDRRLSKMGDSRATIDQQRLFLLSISQDFQSLSRAAKDGSYGDPFFGDARSDDGYSKRLRAVVQNLNQDFAESMRLKGHFRHIVDRTRESIFNTPDNASSHVSTPIQVSRSNFIEEIQVLLKRSRGRELPGMFNPLIIGDLFHEQSKPWEPLARKHLHDICEAVRAFLGITLLYLTDDITSEALLRELVDPLMDEKIKLLDRKFEEILAHQSGHPITYNHYFTDTIKKVRERRYEKEMESRVLKFFGRDEHEEINVRNIKISSLVSALSLRTADMDRYASSEILDCMEAYYKVAIKNFIDNVAIEAVEKLISGIPDVFSPSSILQMEPGLVSRIAAEPIENQTLREQLLQKFAVLKKGLETCKRYVGRTASTLRTQKQAPQVAEANSTPNELGEARPRPPSSSASAISRRPYSPSVPREAAPSPPPAAWPETIAVPEWDAPKPNEEDIDIEAFHNESHLEEPKPSNVADTSLVEEKMSPWDWGASLSKKTKGKKVWEEPEFTLPTEVPEAVEEVAPSDFTKKKGKKHKKSAVKESIVDD